MKLQTPVTDIKCKVGISYSSKITMLGSCFSDNIGSMLADYGFDVLVNPFGTLYNPMSILHSVDMLLSDRMFAEDDCVMMGAGADKICSFSHHTSFARKTKEEFLDNANQRLTLARKHFLESDRVIITLGTSWCFEHMDTRDIVSNCLKRPAKEFERKRLSISDINHALLKIMNLCSSKDGCKKKEFIFTVSPIRHFKDGAHGNQISKAALLVAIDEALERRAPETNADYFPSYEIMMDELRDYRFYTEDMCHPSQQAIDYICERFLSWALPEQEKPTLEANIRDLKKKRHIVK